MIDQSKNQGTAVTSHLLHPSLSQVWCRALMCLLPAVILFWAKNSQKPTLIQVSGQKITAFPKTSRQV